MIRLAAVSAVKDAPTRTGRASAASSPNRSRYEGLVTHRNSPPRGIRAGQVFINNYGAGGGVELPFGGIRKSGHGREKGFEALYGFSVLKTVAAWHG